MYLTNVPFEKAVFVEGPGTGLRAGIRGLPRLESNLYQDAFESQLEQAIEYARLFATVERDDFDDSNVDLVIAVDKADLSFRRAVNLAYFPLALATLTLYIWVGGPIGTDTQYFDVTLHVAEPGSSSDLFAVGSHLQKDHWISLYSPEYWAQDAPCRGPAGRRVLADLVHQLEQGLRAHGLFAGAPRP